MIKAILYLELHERRARLLEFLRGIASLFKLGRAEPRALQRYLASMEGAVLSGKQAAEAIEAADEGRAPTDQSAVDTVYQGDWPEIIRALT